MKRSLLPAACAIACLPCLPILAAEAADPPEPADDGRLEIVVVTGVRVGEDLVLETSQVAQTGPDNSDLLRMFPGANRNANGPLSRISQYRGLFGAQNSVTVDGGSYTADCPNWMDTPLSSIPQSLTETVTLYRGLASVEAVPEGLGGAIDIRSRRGDFAERDGWASYGRAELGYGSNASAWNGAMYAGLHDRDNWIDAAASSDRADDYAFDGGTAAATGYERQQYRFGYGRRLGQAELAFGAAINRTQDSGTPALPMDIRYLDSEQYSFELKTEAGPGRLALQAATLSVTHMMDNFTLRPPPLNPMGRANYRESDPSGDSDTAALSWEAQRGRVQLTLGADAKWESHDARITDPTSERFQIRNFNDVQRDRAGLFGAAALQAGAWDLEAGLRFNRVRMAAGEVDGDLALMPGTPMFVQQERLDELADQFNAADRSVSDNQWAGSVRASRPLGEALRLNLGLGRKARSPSYQERYLWLPLEATAGLADGRTYIGDIGLEPETSVELTLGVDWAAGRFRLTPELYYRDVDGFIQGVPSTNETANRFAMAMGGGPPLQYANVDAEFYGFDLAWAWEIDERWQAQGNLGYVRGRRSDGSDNLYRIAPLSSFAELRYARERWHISLQSVAAARQDKVAAYNDEQETAGWGVLHLRAGIRLTRSLGLDLGVENLGDTVYQDHLGGYNRVRDSDIPVGERLYGTGRNLYLRLDASW